MNQRTSNSSTDELLKHLKTNELFKDLSEEILHKLAENAEWTVLKEGKALFNCGDVADAMYINVSEGLKVTIEKENGDKIVVAELQPNETIGELQFLTGGKRTADIVASRECKVIKLTKSSFDSLGEQKNKLIDQLHLIIRKRLQFNQLTVILPKLFGELKLDEIQAIMDRAEWIQLKSGDLLFKQGDKGDAFYIVLNGLLEVALKENENKGNRFTEESQDKTIGKWGKVIDRLRRGESVGEMSLLTDDNRMATVYAFRDSDLFKFDKEEFHRLLKQYPNLLIQITQILVKRLKNRIEQADNFRKIKKEPSIITIVPASPNISLEDFTRRFTKELSTLYPTLHVCGKGLDQWLGTPGISQMEEDDPSKLRISMWLNSQEQEHRFILLETDFKDSNWTKWCVRQADQVLILADGQADPALGEIEEKLLFAGNMEAVKNYLLVLLHPDDKKHPSGTMKWLEKRSLPMAHHVRLNSNKDFQRLARHLAGDSIGLALGGGGARGFGHIGVLQALKEANIPIDMVGGTSMGSIIAALYAMDWDYESILGSVMDAKKMLFDHTFPMSSLFEGKKFSEELKNYFGETRIEDMWLPFFCVSSNLSRAEIKVHRSGYLWKAIMASNAAPGIFPPVVFDGDLHVDGALLANLPAGVMRNLCNGKVIAVEVSPAIDLAENPPYGDSLSGWKILWRKINPFTTPVSIPSIISILHRAGELASIAFQKDEIEKSSDVYLQLPVEKYHLADYGQAREIVEIGYQYTRIKLEEWNQEKNFLENNQRNVKE